MLVFRGQSRFWIVLGEEQKFEQEIPYKTGGTKFVQVHFMPDWPDRIKGGKVQGIFIIVHDLTPQHLARLEVEKKEAELKKILNGVPALIGHWGSDLKNVNANAAYTQYFGKTPEELRGVHLRDFMGTELFEKMHPYVSAVLLGETQSFETEIKTPSGGFRQMAVTYQPDIADGFCKGFFVVATDISERKRADTVMARINRAHRMRGSSNHALLNIQDEATLLNEVCQIMVNEGGYRMAWVGYAEHDEAKTVQRVAHAGFEDRYLETVNITWEDNERGRGPVGTAIRTGDLSVVQNMVGDQSFAPWHEAAIRRGYQGIVVLPLKSEGRTFGSLAIYSGEADAFDGAEVEVLQELAVDLAMGISLLRLQVKRDWIEKALVDAKEAAERSLRMKSQFLDIAAHELRTPITSLSLLLQLAKKQSETGQPVTSDILLRLRTQSDRLNRLVVDLLDISRLEKGMLILKPMPTELGSLISGCLEEFQILAPKRRFVFAGPTEPVVISLDHLRICQVLSNFLDNAVKYTPPDRAIEIALELKDSAVRVSVIDDGDGIAKDLQKDLFSAFSRGSNDATIRASGLGLGLSVCRGIIELHGGKVGVVSDEGRGSLFYFEIPREVKD